MRYTSIILFRRIILDLKTKRSANSRILNSAGLAVAYLIRIPITKATVRRHIHCPPATQAAAAAALAVFPRGRDKFLWLGVV